MKKLVICEKPSVARDIAKNIGASQNKNGCLEGGNYVVTWALGHLVTLQTPDKYKEFSNVTLENLPMIPKIMKTEIIGKTFKQYKVVENAINRKDISEIIIATDAGREGELVARYILDKAKNKKPIKRLWISSVTDKAIKEGFKNLKDGKLYEGLYHSGIARANADWLVGINASRALTFKYNTSLNCGRVQTPTLQMVLTREEKIKNFKPKNYYSYECVLNNVKFLSENNDFDIETAQNFVNKNKNTQITEIKIEEKEKTSKPAPLYNLTDIQQIASSLYKLSPKQTLNVIQSLYERHKVLTYPRTDSRYITSDMRATIKDRLRAVSTGEYGVIAKNILSQNINTNRIVNDNKVTDHHAIIPTEERPNYMAMSDTELKIYNLVTRRFLENLLPDYKYVEKKASFIIDNKKFVNKTILTKDIGYKIFDSENNSIVNYNFSKNNQVENLKIVTKETSAPSYFTEGTLIYAMENPFEYVESEAEKKILKETNGIGTVATRADILEKLFSNDYLMLDNGKIKTTNKAKQLLNLVPEKIKSPSLTAQWEYDLEKIARNKLSKDKFLKNVEQHTVEIINEIKNSQDKFKHDNISGKKCEKCGSFMLDVDRKGTKLLKCSSSSCKNTKVVSKITNLRCENCHKKMTMFGTGENATYRCSCGNSIKQKEVDKKLKDNKKTKANYNDMKKYMKKDNLENESLKEMLKNLKL